MEVKAAAVDVVAGADKDMEEDEEAEAVITKSLGVRQSSMASMYRTRLDHSQHRNGKLCGRMEAEHT